MNKKRMLKYLILLISIISSQAVRAEKIGLVQYTRGAVIMQDMDGSNARLIAKNEPIQRGEVLITGPGSFTIVKLNDGTHMTIRQNSTLSVEQFNAKKDSTASAVLRLFRGGIRTITGYISKINPNGYKVKTGVTTLGIHGAEFDARLCQDDCEEENHRYEKARGEQLERTVARAVFVKRGLVAKSMDGMSRTLKAGSAIFEGDTLVTKADAYAIVIFRDKSRISLQANTVFRVDEMKFNEDDADDNTALFSLLRGGLRTITGLIGKLNPDNYSMRTSVATIGIRGTGYDLMCTGVCTVNAEEHTSGAVNLPEGDGLYAYVWRGSIDFDGQILTKGRAVYKSDKAAAPVVLPAVPGLFKNNTVPRPDSVDVDEKALFSKSSVEEALPGLYVSVSKGNISLKNKSGMRLDLKAGQSAHADVLGRLARQLSKTPMFQQFDAYPLPDVSNPAVINLNANIGGEESGLVCEIK